MPTAIERPVFPFEEADYLDIGTPANPNILYMHYFTTHDESPQAQTLDRHYVPDKNATTMTTGYQTQFPINMDEYKNNELCEFIRDIAEEQKLNITCPYYKIRLHQPVPDEENTFYCRKFTVGFAIDSVTRPGGEIKTVEGNMNAQGDVVIGKFNTVTKVFTPGNFFQKPGAPTGFTATPGAGSAALEWTAPIDTGSGALTGYEVSSDGGNTWENVAVTPTAYTFEGLTGGTEYAFKVRAGNAIGFGPAATATATPTGAARSQSVDTKTTKTEK